MSERKLAVVSKSIRLERLCRNNCSIGCVGWVFFSPFPFLSLQEVKFCSQAFACLPALQTPLPSSLPLCLMGSDLVSRWSWLHQLQANSSCSPKGEVHASPEPRSMDTAGTSEAAKRSWRFSCVRLLHRKSKLVLQDQPLVEQHLAESSKQAMVHIDVLAQKCLKPWLGLAWYRKGSQRGREAEDMNPEMWFPHFLGNRRSAAERHATFVALLCPVAEIFLFNDLAVRLMIGCYGCSIEVLPLFLIEQVSHVACQRNSESRAQNQQCCLQVKY